MNSVLNKSLLALLACLTCGQIALAQQPSTTFKNPLIAGVAQQPPGVVVPDGAPPPIGDGVIPAALITGDIGASPAVPTGQADITTGSKFGTTAGDLNRAPILVPGSRHGETLMQYTENHPYPGVKHINIEGKDYQYIDSDSPAPMTYNDTNKWSYGGLPTVQKLSRYLVIMGVVVATILMAQASFGMVMGEENAGSRVLHVAGGLMLLLSAFTIWKIVLANMANFNDAGPWDANNHKTPPQILLPEPTHKLERPAAPTAPPRSGIPVLPTSGN